MTRRSKLALVAFAALVAAALWWALSRAKPVDPPDENHAVSKAVEETEVVRPVIESPTTGQVRAPISTRDLAPSPAPSSSLPPTPTSLVHLIGTITDSEGKIVPGTNEGISVTSAFGARRDVQVRNGEYGFWNLEAGEYVLGCSFHGFEPAERRVTLRSDEPEPRRDLVLEPAWTITVHVVSPDGRNLRDAVLARKVTHLILFTIISTLEAPPDRLPTSFKIDRSFDGVSRTDSGFMDGLMGDSRIRLLVPPPVYVSVVFRDQILATQQVMDRVAEVKLVVDPERVLALSAGLIVHVQDGETSEPARGAQAILATEQSTSTQSSDQAGVVRFEDRLPGFYELRITMKNHAPLTRSVSLEPGQMADLGAVTLTKGALLEGRCVDEAGAPHRVSAALVRLVDAGPTESELSNDRYSLTIDERGGFTLPNLEPTRFIVRVPDSAYSGKKREVEPNWTCPPIVVDTRSGPVKNLVLVVYRPIRAVFRPASKELLGTGYQVLSADRIPCAEGTFEGSASEGADLTPGSYVLRLTKGLGTVREIPFTVGSSPATIDVGP